MSTILQTMIAAAATPRTSARAVVGRRPGDIRARPGRWIDWSLGDPDSADPASRVVAARLCNAAALESHDRVLNIAAVTAGTRRPGRIALPFADAEFDVVLVGLGAVYAADHYKMAQELLRVCRRGGRIGLACWTPGGFDGRLISIIDRYLPESEASASPARRGTREHLDALFGHSADALGALDRTHIWRFASPAAWLEASQAPGGRLHALYRAVDPDWHDQLTVELLALVDRFNDATGGSMLVKSDYLEFVVYKSTWRI